MDSVAPVTPGRGARKRRSRGGKSERAAVAAAQLTEICASVQSGWGWGGGGPGVRDWAPSGACEQRPWSAGPDPMAFEQPGVPGSLTSPSSLVE